MSLDLVAPTVMQSLAETEAERKQRILRAWQHYLGEAPELLAISDEGIDDNVRINLADALVSKGVSWLFGADRALAFAVEDDEPSTDKLNEIWPVETRALMLHQLGVNGGVTGHAFVRMREDGRVIVWDPSNVEVDWDDEDIERPLEFRNTWNQAGDTVEAPVEVRRQRVTLSETGQSWEILNEISRASGDVWEVLERATWPRPWAPVFHCQNLPMPNEFWGKADLEPDVLKLIDAIESVAGHACKMVRHRGHPLPYATGEKGSNIGRLDISLGQFLALPNENARVGQLEAAGPEGIEWFYSKLWEAFHYVTRTPPIAFGIVNMSNVAEETVELAYSPAVEKTWDKRLTYGPMLIEIAGRKLELVGVADKRPKPNWPSPVPRSATAEAAALESDRRMGIVSKQTASEQRGYEWDVEAPRILEEASAMAESMQRAFDAGGGGGPGDPPADPRPFGQ